MLFFGCVFSNPLSRRDPDLTKVNPPGTLEVSPGFYVDDCEITNFYWLEYLVYQKRVHGKESELYRSCLPDTSVWQVHDDFKSFGYRYLRHPAYRDFPVVGISIEQAKQYAKWRSDRVMEVLLIRNKKIELHVDALRDSMFTIERYFSGNYRDYEPEQSITHYLEYRIPSKEEFERVIPVADSLHQSNYKPIQDEPESQLFYNCFCGISVKDSVIKDFPIIKGTPSGRKPLIANLDCNVREMTNQEGSFFGSSCIDSCGTPSYQFRQDSNMVNCYTGFRCVAEWKPIEELELANPK
ncbi:MAG: SUMF1/EgtB/PvdO family nonheme iron enzyme [Flavobacteriales bacterium]|nr:SUMF1/EgtB/PvdO family nonheme iron enzyme [Flavobacteriales bacterium]